MKRDIYLEPTEHRYYDRATGREYMSVSEVLRSVKPHFDAPAHALRVAERDGLTVEDVLEQWDRTRNEALERGTEIHKAMDAWHRTRDMDAVPSEFRYVARKVEELLPPNGFRCVERIVYDKTAFVAGTMDLLIRMSHSMGAQWEIWDYKTNREFTTRSKYGDKMSAPCGLLEHCDLNVYSLQLWLYRLMCESHGLRISAMTIVHIDHDGNVKPYRAKNLEPYAQALLRQFANGPEL